MRLSLVIKPCFFKCSLLSPYLTINVIDMHHQKLRWRWNLLISVPPYLPFAPFVPDSPNENGTQLDQNSNEYYPRQYQKELPSLNGEENQKITLKRTEAPPIRVSNNKQPVESSNFQISSSSPGVRITLPAFTVKVSTGQSSLRGIPLWGINSRYVLSFVH